MQAGHGIPSVGQILPYVLRHCWRVTGAGAWRDPGHTVGQAQSASVKPTFGVGPTLAQVYPILFHGLWCAPAHELLLANSKRGDTIRGTEGKGPAIEEPKSYTACGLRRKRLKESRTNESAKQKPSRDSPRDRPGSRGGLGT
jgi:hypothetical protein